MPCLERDNPTEIPLLQLPLLAKYTVTRSWSQMRDREAKAHQHTTFLEIQPTAPEVGLVEPGSHIHGLEKSLQAQEGGWGLACLLSLGDPGFLTKADTEKVGWLGRASLHILHSPSHVMGCGVCVVSH